MHRVLDAADKQQTSLAVLSRVLEDSVKETRDRG